MRLAVRLAAPLALVLLAGCTLVPEPQARDVAGATDGYSATAQFLKVFVRNESGVTTLVDFDRRDWYVSKIAAQLDEKQIPFLDIRGQERLTLGEVVVASVRVPENLTSLRYEAMAVSPEERSAMDLEYDQRLRGVTGHPATVPIVTLPSSPNVP